MIENKKEQIKILLEKLENLDDFQLNWIETIINQFSIPRNYKLFDSTLFNECMLNSFGDVLLIHHSMSNEPFTKDKFEHVTERVSNLCGKYAQAASRGNPGYDIVINNERFSLKTQANREIKADEIHISKFMELGKGTWGINPEDLGELREQFFRHMNSYDRILSLRALSRPLPQQPQDWIYELVEIPKSLLMEARNGILQMSKKSKLIISRPGECRIFDSSSGELKFKLYFDGGSERKLQIQYIKKKYCKVHATWQFPPVNLYD